MPGRFAQTAVALLAAALVVGLALPAGIYLHRPADLSWLGLFVSIALFATSCGFLSTWPPEWIASATMWLVPVTIAAMRFAGRGWKLWAFAVALVLLLEPYLTRRAKPANRWTRAGLAVAIPLITALVVAPAYWHQLPSWVSMLGILAILTVVRVHAETDIRELVPHRRIR